MTNILIIGATGSIGQATRNYLMQNTDDQLTLMARHTSLSNLDATREHVIAGSVTDATTLQQALAGQDVVFAPLSGDLPRMAQALVTGMSQAGVERLLFISLMGIYNEIPASVGASGNLDDNPVLAPYRRAADNLNYTVIRPCWFDNGNTAY